jgi:hypothetical protein
LSPISTRFASAYGCALTIFSARSSSSVFGSAGRPGDWTQQLPQREAQTHERHAHHRAQAARRVGVELEHPPQLAVVRDFPIGEEQDQQAGRDDPRDRKDPRPLERLREQRGASIELPPRSEQQERQHREISAFRQGDAFWQREHGRHHCNRNADHHAASSRCTRPRATTSIAKPATLPMKCEASTSGSGTCSSSRSVASPDSGVTPKRAATRARDERQRRKQQRRDRDGSATYGSGHTRAQLVAREQHGGGNQRRR